MTSVNLNCRYVGLPVLLPDSTFGRLLSLRGDQGARDIMPDLHPFPLECDDPGVILDCDRPQDVDEIEKRLR